MQETKALISAMTGESWGAGMLQEPQTGHVTPGAGPRGDMVGRKAAGKQPRGLLSEGPRVLCQ